MSDYGLEEGPDGVVVIRVGDREYPAKYVRRCLTCRSKYRSQIEQAVLAGLTYRSIVETVVEPYDDHSPLGPPSQRSVFNHVSRHHMALPYSLQRKIIEKRAEELGRSVEAGEETMADAVAIHRVVMQRALERLSQGEIQPSMGDLIKVLQLQSATGAKEASVEVTDEVWREALIEYMAIVQRNVSGEVFQRIGREMASSPALKAISARRQAAGEISS